MTCDIDRTKPADVSRTIGWDGYDYALDLTKTNDKKLGEALRPYLEAAHEKVKQRGPSRKTKSNRVYAPITLGKEERAAIREWARESGFEVGEKGVIPRRVVAAYTEAHSG